MACQYYGKLTFSIEAYYIIKINCDMYNVAQKLFVENWYLDRYLNVQNEKYITIF